MTSGKTHTITDNTGIMRVLKPIGKEFLRGVGNRVMYVDDDDTCWMRAYGQWCEVVMVCGKYETNPRLRYA